MNTLGIPLECFNLDEREFERCKNWANIMKHYSVNDSGSEVDFQNLDSVFLNEKDEGDVEDENDLDDKIDQSVLQLRSLSSTLVHSQSRKNSKHGGIKPWLPFEGEEEEDTEDKDHLGMQSLLDETIPMLVERKRKWKESGMLRVLNTFNEEEIERTVGSWLRHNSNANSSSVQPEKFTGEDDDENESLHSIDTARYVLSNRKPRYSGNFCNSTTIKTYRNLQSKRDALREKYAFPEDELDRAVLERSKKKFKRQDNDNKNDLARYVKTREVAACRSVAKKATGLNESELVRVKTRRKHLKERSRKWCSRGGSWGSSSSDEDYGCGQNNCTSQQSKHHSCRRRPLVLPPFRRSGVFTPLRLNFIAPPFIHKKQFTTTATPRVVKPKKRASDCCCHNKEKLCLQTDHLADTSTEEWLVENCDSPKKLLPKKLQKRSLQSDKQGKRKLAKLKRTTENALKDNLVKKTTKCILNKQDKKMGENENEYSGEDTFENELKLALKLSKEMHEAEAKSNEKKIKKTMSGDNAIESKQQNSTKNTLKKNVKILDKKESSFENKFEELKVAVELSEQKFKTKDSQYESEFEGLIDKIDKETMLGNHNSKQHEEEKIKKEQQDSTIQETTGLNDENVYMALPDKLAKVYLRVPKEATERCKRFQGILPTIQETETEQKKRQSLETETTRNEPEACGEQCYATKKSNVKANDNSSCTGQENRFLPAELPTIIDDFSPNRFGLKPQPRSAKIKKVRRLMEKSRSATITSSNETFFTRADRIYNSTAVTGDAAAVQKQISAEGSSAVKAKSAELILGEKGAEKKMAADLTFDDSDCFIVSSTVDDGDNIEQPLKSTRTSQNQRHSRDRDILIYTPHNRNSVPPECISGGVLNITEEYLSSFIGKKLAKKFMRYYIGCRRFDANLRVYYRPPAKNWPDNDDETDSDFEELQHLNRYGDLHVSFES